MSLKEMINRHIGGWMKTIGPESDVVLSSRVRLARNVGTSSFPYHASEDENDAMLQKIESAVDTVRLGKDAGVIGNTSWVSLADLSPLDRQILVEKHLVSPQYVQDPRSRAVLLSGDYSISVMVNEEDHLRIQTMYPGLQLDKCWSLASSVDDVLESVVDYAFSDKLGYITACPTNLGTGLRASVMVHLPALSISNQLAGVLNTVSRVGLAVRGLYGEGTESVGNIFQMSNQVTLGYSEEEIIANLESVTRQIIGHERAARDLLKREIRPQLEDRIYRAYGLLTNARIMSTKEAMEHLSDVRLGIDMGILSGLDAGILMELMIMIRPAHLQKFIGRELPAGERDSSRAALIRERFRLEGASR